MIDHASYLQIFQQLDSSTTIITPNRRLSVTLHKHYQTYQQEQQHTYWSTPDMLPASSWIQRLWNDYTSKIFTDSPLLLNALQEQFLWEKILLNAKENSLLLQISETADIAKSAWGLLKQWQVDIHHPIFNSAEDYAALHCWTTEFQTICQEKNWIDMAALPDHVIEKIKTSDIIPARHIILIGFTELSPQLKNVFNYCEKSGSTIHHIALPQEQMECHRISLSDEDSEIETMARWAKSTLMQQKNPAAIGCVIPSLDKIRDRVRQIFSEVFALDNTYAVDLKSCPFNISAGKNLLHYSIINTALQLLALNKNNITIDAFGYLLASPFLGEAEKERIRRANFDRLLRQENINTIDLATTIQNNDNNNDKKDEKDEKDEKDKKDKKDKKQLSLTKSCPYLAQRIQQFAELIEQNEKVMSYQAWAILFNQLLSILGWPGERSLSSEEYQIVESWLALLAEYTTLDQVAQPVPYHQALQTLHKMAGKAIFQPKTPEAPIQVLGILEAAALPFDYLWVAGMDDLSWPPQPRPNPFIPKRLQRELQMPHATAERELIYCEQLTQQFKHSANAVIFSHAEKNDELELQASPLIRDLPEINIDTLALETYLRPSERIYQTKAIETILDEMGPPIIGDEKIRGGISVIKQQALCPFKAFSEWRLHAHELENPLPGLRAKDRGTLIHKSLEMLWNRLNDHATLVMMEDEELSTIIHHCVDEALLAFPHSRSTYVKYISLEKQRLHKLLWDWLQIEKEREPFHVLTSEKLAQIRLNQLNLSVRIDRIDELSDGKKLIIDYKTGKNNHVRSWFSDRPEEPQLPVYSLLDPENTIGITFAQVATGEHCFKGVSRYTLDIKGIKLVSEIEKTTALSWDEQLKKWQTVLTRLSDDFYQGVAKVDPKDPSQTCEWCTLQPFCRINEEIKTCHDNDINPSR
jgi:ATP-dependent helicase/nuclease subunit B